MSLHVWVFKHCQRSFNSLCVFRDSANRKPEISCYPRIGILQPTHGVEPAKIFVLLIQLLFCIYGSSVKAELKNRLAGSGIYFNYN